MRRPNRSAMMQKSLGSGSSDQSLTTRPPLTSSSLEVGSSRAKKVYQATQHKRRERARSLNEFELRAHPQVPPRSISHSRSHPHIQSVYKHIYIIVKIIINSKLKPLSPQSASLNHSYLSEFYTSALCRCSKSLHRSSSYSTVNESRPVTRPPSILAFTCAFPFSHLLSIPSCTSLSISLTSCCFVIAVIVASLSLQNASIL